MKVYTEQILIIPLLLLAGQAWNDGGLESLSPYDIHRLLTISKEEFTMK